MTTSNTDRSWMKRASSLAIASALATTVWASGASAQNLITNGNFTGGSAPNSTNDVNTELTTNSAAGTSGLTSWSTATVGSGGAIDCVMIPTTGTQSGNNTSLCGTSYGGNINTGAGATSPSLAVFPGAPPGGGDVLAADSSTTYEESISQTVSGLTIGQLYSLTFQQAGGQQYGYSGSSTDQWNVSWSGATETNCANVINTTTCDSTLMNVAQQSDVGWNSQTMVFKATATSATVTFLAQGTPAGDPPFALLADVSLSKVPEPASLALLGLGFAGVMGLRRRGRSMAAPDLTNKAAA